MNKFAIIALSFMLGVLYLISSENKSKREDDVKMAQLGYHQVYDANSKYLVWQKTDVVTPKK